MIIQANALAIPMPDNSVDLVVTSPPYWALRSYRDGDVHYAGQIGSEPDPLAFVDALLAVTVEIVRVLKPTGSLWVNLGDKYANDSKWGGYTGGKHVEGLHGAQSSVGRMKAKSGMPPKSLMGIPWRYAIGCIDQLGLILRAEVIWNKPNGLPESVKDRVRRNHEQWFHFTKEPRYFSAVDEVREVYAPGTAARYAQGYNERPYDSERQTVHTKLGGDTYGENPLGKLPGSVWSIPTEPLIISEAIRTQHDLPAHYAAFPQELPRKIILGWSPAGVCVVCGEGRWPVSNKATTFDKARDQVHASDIARRAVERGTVSGGTARSTLNGQTSTVIVGYACACTPRTSHRGRQGDWKEGREVVEEQLADNWHKPGASVPRRPGGFGTKVPTSAGEWEYHLEDWTPPATRPGVVLDPFVGTGTTVGVARALGRVGVGLDLSHDYARLATWRVNESGHFAKTVDRTNAERQGSLL